LAKKKSKNNSSHSRKAENKTGSDKKIKVPSALRTMLVILAVIVAIGLVFAAIRAFMPQLLGGASLSGKLAAEVNGQPITQAELDTAYEKLPYQYQMFMSKEQLLDQLIDQLLLRQEAQKNGIEVTDLEAENNIAAALADSNITEDEFQSMLKNKSIDYDELVQLSKDQILIETIINLEVTSKINVTSEQALEYYNQNSESFKNPQVMTIRHILFATLLANRSEEESQAKAQEVFAMIKQDKSNFCTLTQEYSDDKASAEDCGEYEFIKGQLPEQFENWVDTSKIGDVGQIHTVYGTHLVWLINKTPETIIRFSEVQEQIISSLELAQQRTIYSELISRLRTGADITNYFAKPASTEADDLPEENSGITLDVEGTDAVQVSGVNSEETDGMTIEIVPATDPAEDFIEAPVNDSAAKETPVEPTKTQVVIAEPPVQEDEPTVAVDYTACLKSKGTVLYGASWNSDTTRQLKMIDSEIYKYVECAVEGDYHAQTIACKDAGIQAYPTWKIGGQTIMGVYSLEALGSLAGCN